MSTSPGAPPGEGGTWVRPGPRSAPPGARPRLICLAYAGRGASGFQDWPRRLASAAEVCAIQLPAREERLHDAPVNDIAAFRRELLPELRPWLDGSFIPVFPWIGAPLRADL